jgi:hypothetical protein
MNMKPTNILLLLIFCSLSLYAQSPLGEKPEAKEVKLLIDSVCNALNKYYIYPDKAALMASTIKKNYKSGAYNNTREKRELAFLINRDLQAANKDGHLLIIYNPKLAASLQGSKQDSVEKKAVELDFACENNFFFSKVELLTDNIGYIRWNEFTPFVEEAKPTLNAAFQFVSNCNALIIDMRYNRGGEPPLVVQIESYFFNEQTDPVDLIDRSNNVIEGLIDPTKTNFKLNMPVYILTSRYTLSSAEYFSYGMKNLKRAIIVGDTTGGGAHGARAFNLGQNFVGYIPFLRSYSSITGTNWEGTGVWPDVPVISEEALTKAQIIIMTDLASKAKTEEKKNMLRWNLNKLSETVRLPPPNTLSLYQGIYDGGLDFYEKDGHFFCKNAERGNNIFELTYVSNSLFVLDENVQVEFEKDDSGTYSKMKMYWKNGIVTEKRKI